MRLHEIIIESQLDEGPIGRGIGKLVGGAARGIGAIAGGVVGAGTALKKGYQSGKAVVGDDPDPNAGKPGYTPPAEAPTPVADPNTAPTPVADPNTAPTPVADPKAAPAPTTPPTAKDINAAGPEGSAPAKDQTGAAGAALAKTDAVTDKQTSTKAGETVYAQVKANIDKLDAKGKGRILQLVKQSLAAPAPGADPRDLNKDGKVDATEKSMARNKAKPGAAPAATTAAPDPGAAAFGNMAGQLAKGGAAEPTAATPAATPTPDPAAKSQTLTPQQQAAQAATKARLQGTKAAGKSVAASTTGGFKASVAGARAKGIATASKINYGNALSEALARRVEAHKQKMFETGLSKGTISVFRK